MTLARPPINEPVPGDRFGSRVVVKRARPDGRNRLRWLARCACGHEQICYKQQLRTTKHCVKCNGRARNAP